MRQLQRYEGPEDPPGGGRRPGLDVAVSHRAGDVADAGLVLVLELVLVLVLVLVRASHPLDLPAPGAVSRPFR